MLRTHLCDLLGIDVPIILAGMGAGATSAEFAAAVPIRAGWEVLAHYFVPPTR
jgi:NAD(P)H-dependent flavin oxidoreductase YrpB (nitropropane dioxygenase family)